MNTGLHKTASLGLLLLPLLLTLAARGAAAQERDAGIIERIVGSASLRSNDSASPVALDPSRDAARRLHVGESVRAGRRGLVVLILCGGVGRRELRAADGWFKIPERAECRGGDAIAEYGNAGGRDRGPLDVYSPADDEVIRPDAFTLRWKPSPELRSFTARLVKKEGMEEIWSEQVRGRGRRRGLLASAAARRALARQREQSRPTTILLRVEPAGGKSPDIGVTFQLLSRDGERELTRRLARWDAEGSPLMKRLGRAADFVLANMFTKAATEYEAALALAPRSRDLLVRTIQAQCEAANAPRVQTLKTRLPRGTPDPCLGKQ